MPQILPLLISLFMHCSTCGNAIQKRLVIDSDAPYFCMNCTMDQCKEAGTHPMIGGVWKKTSTGCPDCMALMNTKPSRAKGTDSHAERAAKGWAMTVCSEQPHLSYINEAAALGNVITRKDVAFAFGWQYSGSEIDHIAVLNQAPLLAILQAPQVDRARLLIDLFETAGMFVHPDAPARSSSRGEESSIHALTVLSKVNECDGDIGSFDVRAQFAKSHDTFAHTERCPRGFAAHCTLHTARPCPASASPTPS